MCIVSLIVNAIVFTRTHTLIHIHTPVTDSSMSKRNDKKTKGKAAVAAAAADEKLPFGVSDPALYGSTFARIMGDFSMPVEERVKSIMADPDESALDKQFALEILAANEGSVKSIPMKKRMLDAECRQRRVQMFIAQAVHARETGQYLDARMKYILARYFDDKFWTEEDVIGKEEMQKIALHRKKLADEKPSQIVLNEFSKLVASIRDRTITGSGLVIYRTALLQHPEYTNVEHAYDLLEINKHREAAAAAAAAPTQTIAVAAKAEVDSKAK